MRKLLILVLLLSGCVFDEGQPLEEDSLKDAQLVRKDEEEGENKSNDVCKFELFEYAPVNIEETKVFLPLGLMTGSHVTPIDHHYFQNFDNTEYDIEIYSPGDGVITEVQHMPGAPFGEDYRIVIDHGCGVESIFIHLGIFSEEFSDLAPELSGKEYHRVDKQVSAGDLIGYYKTNVDYNIVDYNILLSGFVNPESYKAEPWKQHIPNTYNYFNDEIKQQLIDISLRTVEPVSGKIDYDIKGKLIGNWFLDGTNGYAGDATSTSNYWMGHLAIAYDAYDPTRIVFSIGGYLGEHSRQYTVKGNTPDPADVGVEEGVILYELVGYDWMTPTGEHWNRKDLVKDLSSYEYENVEATLLVQVISEDRIKFEVFYDKTKDEVMNFTDNVKIYTR